MLRLTYLITTYYLYLIFLMYIYTSTYLQEYSTLKHQISYNNIIDNIDFNKNRQGEPNKNKSMYKIL